MKIQVKINTLGLLKFYAQIEVIDQGDFTTTNIFQTSNDFPADIHYQLFPGRTNKVTHVLPSPTTANDWVDAQISALEKHLKSWRQELYSKNYEVEI